MLSDANICVGTEEYGDKCFYFTVGMFRIQQPFFLPNSGIFMQDVHFAKFEKSGAVALLLHIEYFKRVCERMTHFADSYARTILYYYRTVAYI